MKIEFKYKKFNFKVEFSFKIISILTSLLKILTVLFYKKKNHESLFLQTL